MAKKKATKKKAAPRRKKQTAEAVRAAIAAALVGGASHAEAAELGAAAVGGDGRPQLDDALAAMAAAVGVDRAAALRTGIERAESLYASATRSEWSTGTRDALAALRELHKLQRVYDAPGDGDAPDPREDPDAGELAKVEAHLRPLGLGPARYPVSELARVAADRLRRAAE